MLGRRGEAVSSKLKLIYVPRSNYSPEKVVVRMQPGRMLHPNSKAMRLHLPIDELWKKLHECEKTGKDPEELFFDSVGFVSFEPEEIELYDRQIDEVTMKVAIPSDLPDSIGIGKGKRSLIVVPVPKVVTPSNVGTAYGGINIRIIH